MKWQHVLSSAAQHFAAKLVTKFHDLFVVTKVLSPVVYELAHPRDQPLRKVHVKDLKLYHTDP